MIEVLNADDGSRWIEDQIRFGLRSGWGVDGWSNVVVVEARLVMAVDRKSPEVEVKALAFREGCYASMIHVVEAGPLDRDGFQNCGVHLAKALRASLDKQCPPLEPSALEENGG